MNFQKVGVTRPDQIKAGQSFLIMGTDSFGLPLPPQFCITLEDPKTSAGGNPCVMVTLIASLGKGQPKIGPWTTYLDLHSVSVGAGECRMHLERVNAGFFTALKDILTRPHEYPDVMQEGTPRILAEARKQARLAAEKKRRERKAVVEIFLTP